MSLPSFATQTVTILTAGTKTSHGNTEPDWSSPTEVVVTGCSVQPVQAAEVLDHRDTAAHSHIGYLPAGTAVTAASRIRFNGDDYEVVGAPRRWEFGLSTDHVQVLMNLWQEVEPG